MFTSSEIIAAAEARVGVTDEDPPAIRRNLDHLVHAINTDQALPEKGEALSFRALTDRTADRLEAQKWLRDYPEIAGEQIVEPVFLTGLPRSGTTFFQYLSDRDERFRLIRTWEAISPFPPPGYDPESVVRRKAEEDERRRRARPEVKGFAAMHLVDADGPEECHAFMEHGYGAVGFHNLFNVPTYFDYLKTCVDFTEVYRIHRRQLQLLQWRMPRPRWALKYPGHVVAMDNILAGYNRPIDAADFLQEFANNDLRVLDIRGEKEAAPFREKYNDRWFNIPQDQLRKRIGEIPVDEDFYLLCDTGPRSYEAQVFLSSKGVARTRNIQGGFAMIKVTDPTFI